MELDDPMSVAAEVSELVFDVAGQPDPREMMRRVPEVVAKLIDCAAVDVVQVSSIGKLRVRASSDPALSARTEAAWRRWPHQPMPAIAAEDSTVMRLQRSSYLQQLSADTGVIQALMVALPIGDADHG